jgi:hypothetical protein
VALLNVASSSALPTSSRAIESLAVGRGSTFIAMVQTTDLREGDVVVAGRR